MQNLILHRMVLVSDGVTDEKHKVRLKILIFSDFFEKLFPSQFAIPLVLTLKTIVLNSELNSTSNDTIFRVGYRAKKFTLSESRNP